MERFKKDDYHDYFWKLNLFSQYQIFISSSSQNKHDFLMQV